MTLKIVSRHQSGLWRNVSSPAFVQNTKRMRSGECTLVSRTECTDQSTNQTLKRDFDGEDWGVFHPKVEGRSIDPSLEWNKEYWRKTRTGLVKLTDFRVTTQGGVHLLPSMMPYALLQSRMMPGLMVLFTTAHNNLDNTEARADAWLEEGHTFVHWQKQQARKLARDFPKMRIIRIHQADMNKNIRLERERMMVRNHMLANTGLTWGWNTSKLPVRGTNGEQIIDYACCNAGQHGSKVLKGDAFSDHNPIENWMRV